jgi:peptide/nickel transport system substrate-binding protein
MRIPARAVVLALAALLAGCGGDGDSDTDKTDDVPRGGTLRIGLVGAGERGEIPTIDPAKLEFSPGITELHRCCLLRTLVNYRGGTTEQGGAVLRPDLARTLPEVSQDGLTYTFRLKPDLRYAPPYEEVPIRTRDIVRAIEYALRQEVFEAGFFLVIEGAQEFQGGEADTISGFETPDDRTLVVHLTERVGDLGERFATAISAPIPEGADVGHPVIGRVPVSSGPYMVAGAERFDFTRPPSKTRLPRGYAFNRRVTLVRNPAWGNDSLRRAYADRIEITVEGPPDVAAAKVDDDRLDFNLGQLVPTPEQIERYSSDPELERRLLAHVGNVMRYINLNVAVPPFDDIQVRKAVNLAIDKEALRTAVRGGLGSRIAGHIAPDALLNNHLLDYEPYKTAGHRGDLEVAKREMAKSRYDRDRDGTCDAPACKGLLAPVRNDDPSNARLGEIVRQNLSRIGIGLRIKAFDPDTYFEEAIQPPARTPLVPSLGFGPDTLNASNVFHDLFYGPAVGEGDALSLVGASRAQLREWKYEVSRVPNVDDKIEECLRLTGSPQTQCWAETDQLLMERVVPWVPYLFEGAVQVVSDRVARFTFAQSSFVLMPAFDQIALKSGA